MKFVVTVLQGISIKREKVTTSICKRSKRFEVGKHFSYITMVHLEFLRIKMI